MRVPITVGLVALVALVGVTPVDAAVELIANGTFEGGSAVAVPPLSGPLDVWAVLDEVQVSHLSMHDPHAMNTWEARYGRSIERPYSSEGAWSEPGQGLTPAPFALPARPQCVMATAKAAGDQGPC